MGQVIAREVLPEIAATARAAGRRIVFTNGIFDLLHVGHLRSLRAARACGDLLVVGVNDDGSAARLKGPGRPIVPGPERAELLAALEPVDYVVLFGEDTPVALIAVLRPEVYVKGGDYAAAPGAPGKPLPEAEVVRAYGGEVRIIPLVPGRSSTGIVERIAGRHGGA
jgi:rfaE bifunctional protein nucleotidyltransferase chain/domain